MGIVINHSENIFLPQMIITKPEMEEKVEAFVKNAQKEESPSMQTGNASFFVLLFPFFLQLRKFSIMTFSASASVMPSVLSFNSCSSLIRPIAASWMIAASTCFAWISGIDPTWA